MRGPVGYVCSKDRAKAGMDADSRVKVGDNAVDLLICAAHRNLPQRLALGSFAHYLVNHAPCPVLVLRSPVPAA